MFHSTYPNPVFYFSFGLEFMREEKSAIHWSYKTPPSLVSVVTKHQGYRVVLLGSTPM